MLVCLVLAIFWAGSMAYDTGRQAVDVRNAPPALEALWSQVTTWVLGITALMSVLAGLALVEVSLGNEFAKGTAEVLLTRPRRRRSLVWTGYLFGVAELALMMLLTSLCCLGILFYFSGTVVSWRLLATCILLFPMASIVFGIGYLFSVLAKSGPRGTAASLVVMLLYIAVLSVLQFHSHIRRPDWWLDALDQWIVGRNVAFPVFGLIGWTLVSLLPPFLTQWNLERKQV